MMPAASPSSAGGTRDCRPPWPTSRRDPITACRWTQFGGEQHSPIQRLLSRQRRDLLHDLLPMGIGEGTLSLGVGGLPISVFSGLLPSVLTGGLRPASGWAVSWPYR